jgi:glycosyltransferase involved in cell wall biosynthesis
VRLIVFGSGHPFRGGVARTTTELVRALETRGHEMLFLTPWRQYPAWLFPGGDEHDPDACPQLGCAETLLDPLNPRSWPGTRRRARAFGADAWILPYWTWAWAGLWRWLLRADHPPVAAVVHNPSDHDGRFPQRRAARVVLRRCQALFTHARVLEGALRSDFPGRPTASHPLPPPEIGPLPTRDDARVGLDLPRDRRVALFLGLIRPYKGVDLLLDALARLPRSSDWFLVVAGEPWGDSEARLRRQVHDLGLGDRVRLAFGWVPEREVPTLLAAADLVVLPYRSGSQSAVAPLAMAAGVPVLSTRVGGLPEVVDDGRSGMLVEPRSVAELTVALVELDRSRLETLAAGTREVRARLTWNGYAAVLEELLIRTVS